MNRTLAIVLMAAAWIWCQGLAGAQETSSSGNTPHVISSQDLDLLRKDIRSQKKTAGGREHETD